MTEVLFQISSSNSTPPKWTSTVWRIITLSRFCLLIFFGSSGVWNQCVTLPVEPLHQPEILLIVDNTTAHPPSGVLHPNIRVVFPTPNTTSLIEPKHQRLIDFLRLTTIEWSLPCLLLQLRKTWSNSGRIATSVTTSRALLEVGVMTPRDA